MQTDDTGVDAGRLKGRVTEVVSKFFAKHLGQNAADLEEQSTREYDSLLRQCEDTDASEISRTQCLIREFTPSLSSVLHAAELFDRLVALVSPILNAALSGAEEKRIVATPSSQKPPQSHSVPKSRLVPRHDGATSLHLLSVGIDIGSSTSHLVFSRLTLERERSSRNPSNRFLPVNREVIYKSSIIFTPLLDCHTIDIEAVV